MYLATMGNTENIQVCTHGLHESQCTGTACPLSSADFWSTHDAEPGLEGSLVIVTARRFAAQGSDQSPSIAMQVQNAARVQWCLCSSSSQPVPELAQLPIQDLALLSAPHQEAALHLLPYSHPPVVVTPSPWVIVTITATTAPHHGHCLLAFVPSVSTARCHHPPPLKTPTITTDMT